MLISIIFALLIAILAAIFTIQNVGPVLVTFLVWHVNTSLALVPLISLAAGVLISLLAYLPGFIRGKIAISNQRKKYAALEDESTSFKQKAEDSQKTIIDLEDKVASLTAELEKRPPAVAPSQPAAPTEAPASPQPSTTPTFSAATSQSLSTTEPTPTNSTTANPQATETGYPVDHTN